ncbi:hypothetical protein [Actinoplanes sp. NBRC 103695]|uniref:hypothetical protein n=1 Tax=Actinoplanes sp. NBRC 103695 TaxID=3032202 RepID=UPI002555D546|nr:hypothetical protein [Actinoplanes sp. NBRC 103695]
MGVPGHLFLDWHGSSAVISHAEDSPLVLWQLVRNATTSSAEVVVVPSGRAMRDPAGGAVLRRAVEQATSSLGADRIWVSAGGLGSRSGAHAGWLFRLSARIGADLLLPDGPVHVTPDGTHYAGTGTQASGWRLFRAGGVAPVVGNRHSAPAWERTLANRPVPLTGLVADPIPAGVLLHQVTATPTDPSDPAYHLPVDPAGPALVLRHVGAPLADPAQVADLFAGLPAGSAVRIDTRLLDRESAPPGAGWLSRLGAEFEALNVHSVSVDSFLPLRTPRRPLGEGPGLVSHGWVRTGGRLYQNRAVGKLLAEVVPSGILLREAGASDRDGLALVEPDQGVLTVLHADAERLVDLLRRAVAGSAVAPGLVVAGATDDTVVAALAAVLAGPRQPFTVPSRARPRASAVRTPIEARLAVPLEPRTAVASVARAEAGLGAPVEVETASPLAPQTMGTDGAASPDTVDNDRWARRRTVEEPAAATAVALTATHGGLSPSPPSPPPSPPPFPPPAQRPATSPVITVAGPDLDDDLPASGPPPPLAATPPVPPETLAVTDYRPAAEQPVADRGSTADERKSFVAALGPAYTDSITKVNAALAAWPALRQDASVAAKTDLVAVRLFFGRSGLGAAQLNARLREGGRAELPGYLACLVSGLRRLPPSRRAMLCQGRLSVPAQRLYPEGATLVEPAFRIVSGVIGVAADGADVDYLIWSRSARQAGLLADEELDEAVFPAGARFKVLAVREQPALPAGESGMPGAAVLLREMTPGEPVVPGLDDGDRTVLGRLERVLTRRRSSAPRALTDTDAIERLIGPPLGFVPAEASTGVGAGT